MTRSKHSFSLSYFATSLCFFHEKDVDVTLPLRVPKNKTPPTRLTESSRGFKSEFMATNCAIGSFFNRIFPELQKIKDSDADMNFPVS